MNKQRIIIPAIVMLVIFAVGGVIFGIGSDTIPPIETPHATLMDAEWTQDFLKIDANETVKHYGLDLQTIQAALVHQEEIGFEGLCVMVVFDFKRNEITLALRNPDDTVYELIPPYRPRRNKPTL